MNFKELINPKKTINNLPTKFSWQLFIILLVISLVGAALMGLALGFDEIKKILIAYGNYPENSLVSNSVVIQSLLIIASMSLLAQALKVSVITFICQKILFLYKKRIEFFKLINLYLYAASISGLVAIIRVPLMYNINKDMFANLFLGTIDQKEAITQLYTSGGYMFIFFSILSTIIFYIILIYGVKILLTKFQIK